MGTSFYLLLIIILGFLAQSRVVILASLFLLLISELNNEPLLIFFSKHGIEIGLVFLLIAILSTMILNPLNRNQLQQILISKKGFAALAGGLLATKFNGLGLNLLQDVPQLIGGIIFGSLLGIAFLNGIPVGPLTAAGLTALFLYILEIFF
ncbi:MAG: DUF441 domain-containing protein [Halanaerobiaceae bacterium]